jgi:hypothetical protein
VFSAHINCQTTLKEAGVLLLIAGQEVFEDFQQELLIWASLFLAF